MLQLQNNNYRFKDGLKLQKASNEKKFRKESISWNHPRTGRRKSHNCLNMYLLITANEVIAAQRERVSSNWREKMEEMEVKENLFH